MKVFDIALKDLTQSMRSTIALVFMFGVPLLVTGMFYLMLGNIARQGEFNLSPVRVVIANQDEGGPRFQTGAQNIPGGIEADTLGELVVEVLKSEDLANLLEVTLIPDPASARQAVDSQQAQVAVIIPADFSRQFADLYGQAEIEFYQDPTLAIGPGIVKSIMNQFMDGMAGVKIAVNVALEQVEGLDYAMVGRVVQRYLEASELRTDDLSAALLDVRAPKEAPQSANPLLNIIGPLMGGMLIFYAFYTGTASAESILREEETRTLPRLFTTPTPQATILSGKFLAVFLTVIVQVCVLLVVARLIFRIDWGEYVPVALITLGIVVMAASFGIFTNSMLKNTKQGGIIFGGVLTLTGMIGMISVFAVSSPTAAMLGDTVSLLVPQGWAVRGMLQAMNGQPLSDLLWTTLVMLVWSAAFFVVGVWRFRRRYT